MGNTNKIINKKLIDKIKQTNFSYKNKNVHPIINKRTNKIYFLKNKCPLEMPWQFKTLHLEIGKVFDYFYNQILLS